MANLKLRITAVAKEHGMTIAQLADGLGMKAQSLSQAIYRNSFGIEKLGEIADLLGVEVPELFEAYVQPSAAPAISAVSTCPHCGKPITIAFAIGK